MSFQFTIKTCRRSDQLNHYHMDELKSYISAIGQSSGTHSMHRSTQGKYFYIARIVRASLTSIPLLQISVKPVILTLECADANTEQYLK